MNIVQFQPDHARELLNGEMNIGAPANPKDFLKFVDEMVVNGMSFSGIVNGEVIGSGGIVPVYKHMAEVWLLLSGKVYKNRLTTIRNILINMDKMQKQHQFVRLQAAVKASWPEAVRFASWMGFENEGLMRKFGPDHEDYYRFAKVI